MLRSLQWEDLLVFLWVALIEPLLYKLVGNLIGNVQPWDIGSHPNPALGALFFLAVLGGLVVIATQAPGQRQGDSDSSSVSMFAHLPMLVTIGYFLIYGFGAFGAELPFSILCGVFLLFGVVAMAFNRLPVLSIPARRILITPMIVLGSWNFSALMRGFFTGVDFAALLHNPALRDSSSSLTFTLGLLLAAVFVFYLVFILAPRQIAYPGGSWGDWLARFALYVLAIIFNLGWLPLL